MTEHVFTVRNYQAPLWNAWGTKRRLIEIAHRRWGKDEIALNATRNHALQRPASYWHCLPEYAQARKAIWTMVNPHTGKRRIDEVFPAEIRESTNDQEMFIKLVNGSTWQLIGSDRYDTTVGSSPAGIVYSEWALANPSAWGYHRPMVEENNGWAAFITTPRGNNHAKSMLDMAKDHPHWFAEVSSAQDTGVLTQSQMDEALDEYQAVYGVDVGLAMFEQEYMCSFSGALVGAYFGAEMNRAEREGRIGSCSIDENHPVHCVMDLGKAANNPVWLFQVVQGSLRIVAFYRPQSEDLDDWCLDLRALGFNGTTYVPHDIVAGEWATSRTRRERLEAHKMNPRRIAKVSVADGLQAGRMAINTATFDKEACGVGIDGLKSYRRDWDDERKTFREIPVKDWAEHIGSAWRYLGLAWKEVVPPVKKAAGPKELAYEVQSDGRIVGNMSVKEAVDAMVKRRRRDG